MLKKEKIKIFPTPSIKGARMFWCSGTDTLVIIHEDYICLFSFSYKTIYLKAEKKKDPKPIDQKTVSSLHRDTRKTP